VLFEERRVLLRQKLRRLRSSFARQLDVPPYIIFHDTTLDSIVENMPTTRQGLLACYGIGPKKLSDFGEEILDVIAQHRADPDR
jgi:ATP-dependent DNA helicase RecQ